MKWPLFVALLGIAAARAPAQDSREIYLSGHGKDDAKVWDFYCTAGRRAGSWSTIHVPSCWEQEGFGVYEYGVEYRGSKRIPPLPLADEQGLYRTRFATPDSAARVLLVFDGVMTDASVKVNGESAGPAHQGAFYRFKYDITSLLRQDGRDNLLEVSVAKKSANSSVNEAERLGDYWNFGGIFRPVHLEVVPNAYIDWTAIDARADGSFDARVYLAGRVPAGVRVHATIEGLDGEADGSVGAGGCAELRLQARQPKLWTAEAPHLYTATFTAETGGATVHRVHERFGFRTFEVRPHDGLYLNGSRVVLKGVNRHSFWPETGRTLSRQICEDDVRLIKGANMNAARMSHYPPDADFLRACDEQGLYVLDELGGWHGKYDTPTGRKLIGEMVRRDVNHPSVVIWDNGNEGGNNLDNDGQFAVWDPQHRDVLHPWANFGNVNALHYRNYAQTLEACRGPDIYLPTEFLHGLYDGGIGAGFEDYWAAMGSSRFCSGGFFWALLDEAVVRTDQGGRLDARWNLGPDGMVGPHREPEGSYFTIRQIWSPVQVAAAGPVLDGTFKVQNRYDFVNLKECRFRWELARYPSAAGQRSGHDTLASGAVAGPDVAAHDDGTLVLPLERSVKDHPEAARAEALYVTAIGPHAQTLWTWCWPLPGADARREPVTPPAYPAGRWGVRVQEDRGYSVLRSDDLVLRFDLQDGRLAVIERDGVPFSLTGLKLAAYRRVGRKFENAGVRARLVSGTARMENGAAIFDAVYDGNYTSGAAVLRHVRWTLTGDRKLKVQYAYAADGTFDILGVAFDYPESLMEGKRWLGRGPYHQWENRIPGTTFDVWQTAYNHPIHGESWTYPEFKGFFTDWRWADFATGEGHLIVQDDAPAGSILGVYTPPDGRVGPVLEIPDLGIGFYDVFPAIGNKNHTPELLGPHSQPQTVSGVKTGALTVQLFPR